MYPVQVTYTATTTCLILTLLFSIKLVLGHVLCWKKPKEQTSIVVIILMAPLYAVVSYIGLLHFTWSENAMKLCYLNISMSKRTVPDEIKGREIHHSFPMTLFQMTTILQVPIITSASSNVILYNRCKEHRYSSKFQQATNGYTISSLETGFHGEKWSFLGGGNLYKDGGFRVRVGDMRNRRNRVILVRSNQGFGLNGGGGGGGGGQDDGSTGRVLGNLAVAIGLTYLTMTGQLGWILDAIVSLWIIAFLLPIVGFGAFLWWAGRDIVQSSCPNCGNEFQILRSTINDEPQLCPFCTQPFSVADNKFVRESEQFFNESTTFQNSFNKFSESKKREVDYSSTPTIVDIEAEVRDVD